MPLLRWRSLSRYRTIRSSLFIWKSSFSRRLSQWQYAYPTLERTRCPEVYYKKERDSEQETCEPEFATQKTNGGARGCGRQGAGSTRRRTGRSEREEAENAVHTIGSGNEYIDGDCAIAHDSHVSLELKAIQHFGSMPLIAPVLALGDPPQATRGRRAGMLRGSRTRSYYPR
jgi:hypothetical protein